MRVIVFGYKFGRYFFFFRRVVIFVSNLQKKKTVGKRDIICILSHFWILHLNKIYNEKRDLRAS